MFPVRTVADAHGVDVAVERDDLFARAHPAERVAFRVDLRLVETERFHFRNGAADDALFLAALARDADEVTQELCHLGKVLFGSSFDLIEVGFHDALPSFLPMKFEMSRNQDS